MRPRPPLVAALILALVAVACGDSSTPPVDTGAADSAFDASDTSVDAADTGGGGAYCPVVGYSQCGGDLVGTWAFRALCPEDPAAAAALCEHPYDDRAVCMGVGNEAVCDGRQEGTLVFGADGSLEVDTTTTLIATWNFTDECLADVATSGTTPEEHCAAVGNDRLTCTYEDGCTCVGDPIVEMDTNTSTWEVVGDDLTLGDDPPATYCIEGDLLTMDYYAFHPVSWRYWVLERQ